MNKRVGEKEKQKVVERYLCGETVASICKDIGCPRSTVYDWIRQYKSGLQNHQINLKDYKILKTMYERQKLVVHILQNAPCKASDPLHERLEVIRELSAKYTVHTLCYAFNVPKGTYYNYLLRSKGEDSQSAKRRAELKPIIEEIYNSSNQTFGAGKVAAILRDRGFKVSEKVVGDIMHTNGWFSIRTNAKTLYEHSERRKDNILKQNFKADRPNQVWVSDVTYFSYNERRCFICIILDLYSRKVVAFKISKRNSTQLTKATFKYAYFSRKPQEGLIFHSDNGSNYISRSFYAYLKQFGVIQSFSRSGHPCDNAVSEAFFKYMKAEELYRYKYKSERQFRKSVSDYIEQYNSKRPHTYLGYLSPDRYEELYSKNPN